MQDADRAFSDDGVRAAFERHPEPVRSRLLRLRELVFETAADLDGVGPIEEALRWGEPAYLTSRSKTGTTIRLDSKDPEAGHYALYVHCQTDLVPTWRAAFGERLTYEGNRALTFDAAVDLPEDLVRDCIAQALTYKLRRRGR